MKMYIGVTDNNWYENLKNGDHDEINFWRPGGKTPFKALNVGDMFLFKLHNPLNYLVGGGFFLNFSLLPISLAWDAFEKGNGANSFAIFQQQIYKYRKTNRITDPDPQIGCIILSMPFFFDKEDYIDIPNSWSNNIVQGKSYEDSSEEGSRLFKQVQEKLEKKRYFNKFTIEKTAIPRYGKEQIIRPRVGQGAFKILIADAYHRRCAVTGEKTLPVLEAAHIKPYSEDGPHSINNGLFLRRDFHTLFDRGYITIDKNMYVEVSHRIKEDFGNGKEYYAHHGQKLSVLPDRNEQLPDHKYLEWHNENVYLG